MFGYSHASGANPPHPHEYAEGRCVWCGLLVDSEREPRAITGAGPQGPADGMGRGPLTHDDQRRILALTLRARERLEEEGRRY